MTDAQLATLIDHWGAVIIAIGAIGTAAFGIVEGFKWTDVVGLRGFNTLKRTLGTALVEAQRFAYGEHFESLIRSAYRSGRGDGNLSRILRQGVRAGLRQQNAAALASAVGESVVVPEDLTEIARLLSSTAGLRDGEGAQADAAEQHRMRQLGRFELAVDMRIDAAIAAANSRYTGAMRGFATLAALLIVSAVAIGPMGWRSWSDVWIVLIISAAAVPVAPIAKDLSGALTAAAQSLSASRLGR